MQIALKDKADSGYEVKALTVALLFTSMFDAMDEPIPTDLLERLTSSYINVRSPAKTEGETTLTEALAKLLSGTKSE